MGEIHSVTEAVRIEGLALQQHHRFDVLVEPGVSIPLDVLVGQAHHPCLALVAGVHGDEYDGILALQELVRELELGPLQGALLVIPVANPAACTAAQRLVPQDGRDLNRVFPGKAEGSLAERLAALLSTRLLRQADAVFSLHGASSDGTLSPWLEFLDQPTPVGRASYAMARASGFADLIALPSLPGLLQGAMGDMGIPLVEGEAGGRGITQRENVVFYKERAYAIARHVGVLSVSGHAETPRRAPAIWRLDSVEAEADGLFLREVALRQRVRRGERLGRIVDGHGELVAEVWAPQDGAIGGYRTYVGVRAGQSLFTLWTPAGDIQSAHVEPASP